MLEGPMPPLHSHVSATQVYQRIQLRILNSSDLWSLRITCELPQSCFSKPLKFLWITNLVEVRNKRLLRSSASLDYSSNRWRVRAVVLWTISGHWGETERVKLTHLHYDESMLKWIKSFNCKGFKITHTHTPPKVCLRVCRNEFN